MNGNTKNSRFTEKNKVGPDEVIGQVSGKVRPRSYLVSSELNTFVYNPHWASLTLVRLREDLLISNESAIHYFYPLVIYLCFSVDPSYYQLCVQLYCTL